MAAAPASSAASATLTEPNTLVLTPSVQFSSRIGHVLQRRGVEHDRPAANSAQMLRIARAVAHVGDDAVDRGLAAR